MQIHKDKDKWLEKRPKLLQALAWDLMCATFPEARRWPPDAIRWLMVLALGLPPEHEAGDWAPNELDRRGGSDRETLLLARLVEWLYKREYGKQIKTGRLVKELEELGRKVPKPTIRKWRKQRVRMPSWNWFTGDDPGELAREIVGRWRAGNKNRPGDKAGPSVSSSKQTTT
jgi:hypothetical protein